LERLDSLIIKRMAPLTIEKTNCSQEQLTHCVFSACEECDKIRCHLLDVAENVSGALHPERLFRHYQTSLVHLLDTLAGYKLHKPDTVLNKFYDALTEGIEDLLKYIKTRFYEFFNLDGKVPKIAQVLKKERLRLKWDELQPLIAKYSVKEELIKAVGEPITLFLEGTYPGTVTFRWIGYLNDLADEIKEWANSEPDDPEWELLSIIINVDLNSRRCRAYWIKYMVRYMDGADDPTDRLDRLERLDKMISVVQIKPNTTFNSKQTPIREHMQQWVHTETDFANRKMQTATDNIAIRDAANNVINIMKKILSSLTVPEQGAWVRAQMEAGVILNEELKEVMEIIAATHETPHSAQPSSNTLARKSGDLPVQSLKKLQRMARDMDIHFTNLLKGR
jgi:hypothetical protein